MRPHKPPPNGGDKKISETKHSRSRIDFKRAGLAIATTVILSVLLSVHLFPGRVSLSVGDVSEEDIIAHVNARYRDTSETELKRTQAAERVGRVYNPVTDAADRSVEALKTVFQTVETVGRTSAGVSAADKVAMVRARLGAVLGAHISDDTLRALLASDSEKLEELEKQSLRLVSAAMSTEITDDPESLAAARKNVQAEANRLLKNADEATWVGEVAKDSVIPNRIYSDELTAAAQAKARENVRPVYRLIVPGEVVVAKGETVLRKHMEMLEALGLTNPKVDYRSVGSLTMLVIVAVALVAVYLGRYHPDVYGNTKTLLLLAVIVVACTAALRIGGSMLGIKLSPAQVGHFGILWIVAAGMLIAVLVNPQTSVVIVALLSIVLSLMLNSELRYAVNAFVTSLVGIYSVANIRDRNDLMKSVGAIAAAGLVMVWVTGGISNDSLTRMLTGSAWAVGIAMGATWLFWIGTALLERPFGRTTHVSLLELADTNQPILRRLVMEAPGTYTHSVAVGHLAESAAKAIGADPLVARVTSYYHDIGKIRRPHFFIENQNMENIHDRMNPTLSALVITSHIKDGIEIAREFRLPRIVQDVIRQHHGTSLVQYFYSQFSGEQEPSTAVEQQFRYQGPKPRTKEAAIVMLADSVEAASRCISKPTPAKIELLVNRIIADKLGDGQLDECDLTFREVRQIGDSFAHALAVTMHARIDYPDAPIGDTKGFTTDANSGAKLSAQAGKGEQDQKPGPTAAAG